MSHIQQAERTPEIIKEQQLFRDLGLNEREYTAIQTILGRLPNETETSLFAAMWSEHCSYKHSHAVLKKFPTTDDRVLQGPGEGAGVLDIGDKQAVVFKMESHNHPAAIVPYEGAATGAGGIMRDVFSMGARPIALLHALRFGDITTAHRQDAFKQIVAGFSDYGNRMGIPTVGGDIQFAESYADQPLVNAMCVGMLHHDDIHIGKANGAGHAVMYLGARTGRAGVHGAAQASGHDVTTEDAPTTPVGDPYTEKLLMEACFACMQTGAVVGVQDMGAAGLTSAACEMAAKANTGIDMDLDCVPQCECGMLPYEIMLSESQERMLLVVKKGCEQHICDIAEKWGISSATIGRVTDENALRIRQGGAVVADVPATSLADGVPAVHPQAAAPQYMQDPSSTAYVPNVVDTRETLLQLLRQPTIAEKSWLYTQTRLVSETADSQAAVWPVQGTSKALAFATSGNAHYVYLHPKTGGAIAVTEAARKVVCTGAEPLALTNCLNFGSPEDPEVYWQLEQAVDGMSAACQQLDTPVISGNVSLYNETDNGAVAPTPVVGMVGLLHDRQKATGQAITEAGDLIYLLGTTTNAFGGSALQQLVDGERSGQPPALDMHVEAARQRQLLTAIDKGLVTSAQDISMGGLGVALAKALIPRHLGAVIETDDDLVTTLFSESQSRFLVSIPKEQQAAFEAVVDATHIGEVTAEAQLTINNDDEQTLVTIATSDLQAAWEGALPCLLQTKR